MTRASNTPASRFTLADIPGLPPVLDLKTAARLLGIGSTTAYQMAQAGTLPVPVLRHGRSIRIPTAPLLRLLGLTVPGGDDGGGIGPEPDPAPAGDGGTAPARPGAPVPGRAPDSVRAGDAVSGRTVARDQDSRPGRWTPPGESSVHRNPGPADFPPHRSDDHRLPGPAARPDPDTRKEGSAS